MAQAAALPTAPGAGAAGVLRADPALLCVLIKS